MIVLMCRNSNYAQALLCTSPVANALQPEGAATDQPGFCATAAAAKDLADENSELQSYLVSNAELLRRLEREVLHAESLSVQLLQSQAVC